MNAPQDYVDRLLDEWARQRLDLDFSPVGVVARLGRVRTHLDTELKEVFARYHLSPADFVAIVSLRRAGAPYHLPQAQLMVRLGLTSGTVSVRVDRLVTRGIVVREDAPDDRRTQLVRLTDEGLRLFDEIAPVHLANEDRLLSALNQAERHQLSELLQQLLLSFEETSAELGAPLGVELHPAHVARSLRATVGLSDPPGLLVASSPPPGSDAAEAGLLQGDLITAINDQEMRNGAALARLVSGLAPGTPLRIAIFRGEQPRVLTFTRRTAAAGI